MKLNVFPAWIYERQQIGVFDHFVSYNDGQLWTKGGTGGTETVTANTAGGIMALATGGTLNNGAFVATTNAIFQLLANRPWYVEARLQYAEANTNTAMVAFGLSSVVTNVLLQDTTGTPATSFTGALIYKAAGATTWSAITSNGTTQQQNTGLGSSQPNPTTNNQLLRIEGRDVDGSNFEVTFFANDQPILDATSHRPIKQTVAIASAAAMKLVAFAKTGSGTGETVNVDYLGGLQLLGS